MSEAATAVAREAQFQVVGIEQVQESKTNPRKHFAKDALSDLTKSIGEKGILVPLLVRQVIGDNVPAGHYEILAGARRYRAAKAAGLKQVPILIRQLDDEQALEVQVIENLQRQDVHPLEEAEGYKQLLAKGKYDVEALAAKVGKSTRYIYARMQLAELLPTVKKAFEEENITAGHAILLARLQPKDQIEALKEAQYHTGEFCSVRDLGSWIHENIHLELKTALWDLDDKKLLPAAGSCKECPKRSGANPELFHDVKAKDTCTDPGCFDQKMKAHLVQIQGQLEKGGDRVVFISMADEYGKKKTDGVLSTSEWKLAETNEKCKGLATGLVVEGGWYQKRYARGAQVRVCTDKKCKAHWGERSSSSSSYGSDPATKAKERKTRALEAARTAALTQIAAKVKNVDWQQVALRFAGRTTFDGQKLACKVLGVWPKDGKVGGFDFRKKLEAYIEVQKAAGVTQVLAVLTLIPEYGRFGDGYYASEEIPALRAAGKKCGVNVKALERKFVAEAIGKAKKKTKSKAKPKKAAKSQTPAKPKKASKTKKAA